MQIFQKPLCFPSVSIQIRRDNIHIISGTNCFFLLLNFHPVNICNLCFYQLNRFHLVNGLDMKIHKQIAVHFQKFRKHFISQLRCQNLQVGYCPDSISHLKIFFIFKYKTGWCNIVLGIQSGTQHIFIVKPERDFIILVERFIHNLQTLHAIQRISRHP